MPSGEWGRASGWRLRGRSGSLRLACPLGLGSTTSPFAVSCPITSALTANPHVPRSDPLRAFSHCPPQPRRSCWFSSEACVLRSSVFSSVFSVFPRLSSALRLLPEVCSFFLAHLSVHPYSSPFSWPFTPAHGFFVGAASLTVMWRGRSGSPGVGIRSFLTIQTEFLSLYGY